MFWFFLFFSIFLANVMGIALGHFIAERLKMRGVRPVKIMLPLESGELIPISELANRVVVEDMRGDGGAEFFGEPDSDEYDQYQLEQREEWGIIRGLKKVLKAVRKD